ncbi:MAG: dihydroxyacetone kinase, DhaK subunit, partial [Acidimicrobiaceae bacterium]|nr:dihydroxyacetone kinase, DhaK subunit [Acidimicrobiaceae bacterium]
MASGRHRHFVNDPQNLVEEALEGFELAHRHLVRWNRDPSFVVRSEAPAQPKVALVSGGGSGHEPLHVGFVGTGMLDAAVPGAIFASPAGFQIEQATRMVASELGALYVVKNYTGDVLNFQMAAELVAGEIEVASVVTNDDVAVQDSLYTAGR